MSSAASAYVPAPHGGDWQRLEPADAGFDPAGLQAAIDHAVAHESPWPRSMYHPDGAYVGSVEWNEHGPGSEIVGPVRPRGAPAGLVLRQGRIVAEWGETTRTDMTFSIAKSYLAILAGLAVADGLIGDVEEPVAARVNGPWFEGAHNGRITWRHFLQGSSEWTGTLFGKPDQIDHRRQVGPGADNSRKGEKRELHEPGSFYEYNDVRVNLLSLALLHVFRRPLPEVLRERIMAPIGASPDWEWLGYDNADVGIDGRTMRSVPGGGHWGGGLFIGARDHARLGLLVAREGNWGGRQLIPAGWIRAMLSPSPTKADYGYLWWLKPDGAVAALGAGSNHIWIDAGRELVVVLRWIENAAADPFFTRLKAARR